MHNLNSGIYTLAAEVAVVVKIQFAEEQKKCRRIGTIEPSPKKKNITLPE